MRGEIHQQLKYHIQQVLGRTWLLLLLTLLVMVSPTQEEAQEEGMRDSFRDIAINDLSQDDPKIREIFEPRSRRKRSILYPGTKWCGDGDAAKDYADLGRLRELDMCCREHDNCNDSIPTNGIRHGLHNSWAYTSSNCDCDDRFRACLEKAGTSDSEFVGGLYFDVARCFKYSYPARCVHNVSRYPTDKKCLEYAYNTTQKKQWQFFDVPPWRPHNKHHLNAANNKETHIQTLTQNDNVIYDLHVKGEDLSEDQVKDMFISKSRRKRFIYPGTLWCGDGTNAKEYDELGSHKELDMCCRDHDNCNDSIPANGNKHGLHNPLPHTSSHCDCDATFRECLHKLKGFHPGMVGGVYFQIAVCFEYSNPSHCVSRIESGNRCLKYKHDKKSAKTWQFFDTLPWKYVPPTAVTSVTIQYTTATEATEEPPRYPLTSRAASITMGSTVTVITVAAVVTLILYNKMKDGNTCCACKKNNKYKIVSTVEDFV